MYTNELCYNASAFFTLNSICTLVYFMQLIYCTELFDVVISFYSVQPLIQLRCVARYMLRAMPFILEIIFLLFCHLFFFYSLCSITHSLSKTEHEIDYARNDDFLTLFRCFGVLHLQLFFLPHAMAMQFSLCYDI